MNVQTEKDSLCQMIYFAAVVHLAEKQEQPKCKALSAGYSVLQAAACVSLNLPANVSLRCSK